MTRFAIVFFLCISAVQPTCANPAGQIPPSLAKFVGEVNTLSGRFVQTQTDEYGELILAGEGQVSIERPGRFRWAYEEPYEQLMICDGETIWAYDKDLAQVTVRPAGDALSGTPAELLARNASLTDSFAIEAVGESEGLQHVRLTPHAKESDFKTIELWLDDGVPRRLRFSDPLGGHTEVELLGLKINTRLDGALFHFDPPPGTEVVTAEAGQ